MTPNTISNLVFIGLALAATILQHWFAIPSDLLTFLWTLAGFNGVKTATTSQLAHDTQKLGLNSGGGKDTTTTPGTTITTMPTKFGTP